LKVLHPNREDGLTEGEDCVRGCWFWAALITATAVASVIELGTSAVADSGDKPGWSVLTDPRRRAFLIFVPAADGPRVLTLGCLRDVDSFTVLSTGVPGMPASQRDATLTLENGQAHYEVHGNIEADPMSQAPTFDAYLDADAQSRRGIAKSLLPVLERGSSMLLTVGSAKQQLPMDGLAQPLGRSRSVCFTSR
jgi:hypothetical protein